MRVRCLLALLALSLLTASAMASEPIEFLSEAEANRFSALISELRCLVCQNQSLADSDAPLAADLRAQVLEQIRSGQDDGQIKTFLVNRYGDFVLYRPPLKRNTLVLWLGPLLLLLLGAVVVSVSIGRRSKMAAAEVDEGNSPP